MTNFLLAPLDLKSVGVTVLFMLFWNFITKPRPEPTYERIQVAQCIVESRLIFCKLPRRWARFIANRIPYSLLPL